MAIEIACERRDGICNLCGTTDPDATCMLLDMAAEVAEWANAPPVGSHTIIDGRCQIRRDDGDECESCQ